MTLYPAFMAFVQDDHSASVLRSFATAHGWPAAAVQQSAPDVFAKMLEETSPPALVVMDLDGMSDALTDMSRLIDICGSATKFIAIGLSNDVRLYRELVRLGVADYLPKPISEDALTQAHQSAHRTNITLADKPADDQTAHTIVVLGTQGGVGATSLAVNLAWILSQQRGANVGLLDLDPHFGGCALALDVEASRGLRELLADPARVDSLMLASSMMMAAPRLAVLSCEESLDEPLHMDPAALGLIVDQLRQLQDWLVMDMPRSQMLTQKNILSQTQSIFILAEPSLQGVRDVVRLKKYLASTAKEAKIYILLSRTGAGRPNMLDEAAFNKGIDGKIALTLPEDKAMLEANKTGKALVALNAQSPLASAYVKLADMISPAKGPTPKGGWLEGLLKGTPKKPT